MIIMEKKFLFGIIQTGSRGIFVTGMILELKMVRPIIDQNLKVRNENEQKCFTESLHCFFISESNILKLSGTWDEADGKGAWFKSEVTIT